MTNRALLSILRAAVIGLLAAALVPAPATAAKKTDHCVIGGDDLNEIFATSDAFVVSPFCTQISAGDTWRPVMRWDVAGDYDVKPAGYTPVAPTPLEDFLAKFDGARYVVDAGKKRERSFAFSADELILIAVSGPEGGFAAWMPRLRPLPPGTHTIDIYTRVTAMHCDGTTTDPAAGCIPAGESFVERVEFTVRRGRS